jgi:hypothetical protein
MRCIRVVIRIYYSLINIRNFYSIHISSKSQRGMVMLKYTARFYPRKMAGSENSSRIKQFITSFLLISYHMYGRNTSAISHPFAPLTSSAAPQIPYPLMSCATYIRVSFIQDMNTKWRMGLENLHR